MQKKILFLHIPKAGGTTLHSIIKRQYAKKQIYDIHGKKIDDSIDNFKQLPLKEKKQIKCVKGHFFYGIHKYLPDNFLYIAFLRNPIERAISEYYYLRDISKNKIHKIIHRDKLDLADYVSSDIAINTSNIQTRFISGNEEKLLTDNPRIININDYKQAKYNLLNNFAFIGLTEHFDESLLMLKKIMGWKNVYYYKKNVNKKKKIIKNIPQKTIKIIENRNKFDMELYECAQKIFKQNVKTLVPDMQKQINKLQKKNKLISPFYKIIDTLDINNLERILKKYYYKIS